MSLSVLSAPEGAKPGLLGPALAPIHLGRVGAGVVLPASPIPAFLGRFKITSVLPERWEQTAPGWDTTDKRHRLSWAAPAQCQHATESQFTGATRPLSSSGCVTYCQGERTLTAISEAEDSGIQIHVYKIRNTRPRVQDPFEALGESLTMSSQEHVLVCSGCHKH